MRDPDVTSHAADLPVRVVVRAQLGEGAAMARLLEWTRPWLASYLSGLVGGSLAEDAAQEVLLIVARKVSLLDEPRAYRAWVYRVATRHGLRVLKRSRPAMPLEWDAPAREESPPPDAEELARIRGQIDRLSPNSRAVMALHYEAGLSIATVADVLGVPAGTVKSRLNAALNTLRRALGTKEH